MQLRERRSLPEEARKTRLDLRRDKRLRVQDQTEAEPDGKRIASLTHSRDDESAWDRG